MDPTKQPKNFQDAMSREDSQDWATALDKEYMGVKHRGGFELVPFQKGMKLMRMTTRWEYKVTNGTFEKRKVLLPRNQQIAGIHFKESDLCAPVLKAHEVLVVVAIAAQREPQYTSTTPPRLSCTETWMKTCMLGHPTGGRS